MNTIARKLTPFALESGMARLLIHVCAWSLGRQSASRALAGIFREFVRWSRTVPDDPYVVI